MLFFMPFGFILRGDRRVEVLTQNSDAGETFFFRPRLSSGNGSLESGSSRITFAGLGDNEPESDQGMWIFQC